MLEHTQKTPAPSIYILTPGNTTNRLTPSRTKYPSPPEVDSWDSTWVDITPVLTNFEDNTMLAGNNTQNYSSTRPPIITLLCWPCLYDNQLLACPVTCHVQCRRYLVHTSDNCIHAFDQMYHWQSMSITQNSLVTIPLKKKSRWQQLLCNH